MTLDYTLCFNITHGDLIPCSSEWTEHIEILLDSIIDSAYMQSA